MKGRDSIRFVGTGVAAVSYNCGLAKSILNAAGSIQGKKADAKKHIVVRFVRWKDGFCYPKYTENYLNSDPFCASTASVGDLAVL